MSRLRRAGLILLSLAVLAILGTNGGAADAHTGGKSFPSYAYHNSFEHYTVAKDGHNDGHCVYAGYVANDVLHHNGATSCGLEIAKVQNVAPWAISHSTECITGHWVCNG